MKADNGHPRMATHRKIAVDCSLRRDRRHACRPAVRAACADCSTSRARHRPTLPEPQDVPYPGRDQVARRRYDARTPGVPGHARPCPSRRPGRMTLLYPQWLPGNHSPTGPIDKLAGLMIRGNGGERHRVAARRRSNMHAFHVDVPAGVEALDAAVRVRHAHGRQPVARRDDTGPAEPAVGEGTAVSGRILRAPDPGGGLDPACLPGWQFATALRGAQRSGDTVRFARASLETLVDSPLCSPAPTTAASISKARRQTRAAQHLRRRPGELEATDEQLEHASSRAVREAVALFGSRHFREYDFLLAISEHFSGIGLEHHESSENGVGLGYFTDWTGNRPMSATCCRTRWCIRGTASSGGRPISGRRPTTSRCSPACCGCTRA